MLSPIAIVALMSALLMPASLRAHSPRATSSKWAALGGPLALACGRSTHDGAQLPPAPSRLIILGADPMNQGTRRVTVMWGDVVSDGMIYAEIDQAGTVTTCPALYSPAPGARGCQIAVPVGTSDWRARVANVNGYGPWSETISITVPPAGDPPGPFIIQWVAPRPPGDSVGG